MDPLKAQMNRLMHSKGKKRRYRKEVETFSHHDRPSVQQWVDFMATTGFYLDGEIHPNQFDETLWTAKMVRVTR